jgi:hypothetical protein
MTPSRSILRGPPEGAAPGSERSDEIVRFFSRLPELEPLIRAAVPRARVSARLEVRSGGRGSARPLLLDLAARPIRVELDEAVAGAGSVVVAAEAEDLHAILRGELAPGRAFGERRLLLRGSALQLGRFLPLLELAPLLYRSMETTMREPSSAHGSLERSLQAIAERAAFGVGYAFAWARRLLPGLDLFPIARSLGRGLAAADPGGGRVEER